MAQKKEKAKKAVSNGACPICGVDKKLMTIIAIVVIAIAVLAIVLLMPKGDTSSKNQLIANVPVVVTLVSDKAVSYDTQEGKYQITLNGGSGNDEAGVESVTIEVGKPAGDFETIEIPVSGVSVVVAMNRVGDLDLQVLSALASYPSGSRQISAQVQLCYKCG
jgi:hypothetical protein